MEDDSMPFEDGPLTLRPTEAAHFDEDVRTAAYDTLRESATLATAHVLAHGFDAGDCASGPESGVRHVDSPLPL